MGRTPRLDARQQASYVDAFSAHFPTIHRFLRRRIGAAIAEDVAAQTFATAYANWDRYDEARSVRPWLYGIATNLLRHHRRAEERQLRAYARTGIDPTTGADEADSIERLDALMQRRRLAAALANLRPAEREVLLLHAWAELSDGDIAAALSLPVGTVKSRLHRARQQLRNSIGLDDQQTEGTVPASTGSHE